MRDETHNLGPPPGPVDVGLSEPLPLEGSQPLDGDVQTVDPEIERLNSTVAQLNTRIVCIQEIATVLGSTVDLSEMLAVMMEKITLLMDADRSTLFLIDRDNDDTLWSKVTQGDHIQEIRLAMGEGIAGWVAESGQSVNISDAYNDLRFNSDVDIRTGYKTSSILCQPIRNPKREIIGVIQVLNKRTGRFTVQDENLLSSLASQAAVSIENSVLYLSVIDKNQVLEETQQRLEKMVREMDLLYTIQQEISTAFDLPSLIKLATSQVIEILTAEVCAVAVRERGHLRMFTLRTNASSTSPSLEVTTTPSSRGICARVIEAAVPLVTDGELVGESVIPGLDSDPTTIRNVLAVPFFSDGEVIGAMKLINRLGADAERGFGDDDVKLLTLMAGQIAKAVATTLHREEEEKANRLATIGQMLSGVIHDFKTPVTIISGYVQLMAAQDSQDKRNEYADAVLNQFDQLNKMTKEILAFARGESSILLRKIFLHRFADELRELLTQELADKDIELTIDARFRGAVKMDDVKMKRAIFNLARNAAEAMPDGGSFTMTLVQDGDDVVFSFTDTGDGIPEAIRDSVFDSFVTQGKKEGTGLGLAIVKKIVEQHQGSITFTSEVGRGTTFVIRIPITPEP